MMPEERSIMLREGKETTSAEATESKAGQWLEERILDRSAKLGVVGLGYVGLALALEMAKQGFQVTGMDIDKERVDSVNAGISYILDLPSEVLLPFVSKGRIKATQALSVVEELDAVSICVPTPLRKTKDPDLSYVVAAVETVRNHLRPGQLIILESTTYPGTTRELVLPVLEETGLQLGEDFFLAYSPERVDPASRIYNTRNVPKVVGGMTPRCTKLTTLLYRQFIESIIPVSSPEAAEMVKLLENTFRSTNIALVNEMALMCHKLGINVWEVIEAAKTKPFGFMPFHPGPGLGGHCAPVDPYYLAWKVKMNGFEPRLIETAGQINSHMPCFTISRIADALNDRQKSLKGSKILALGVAYKRDTNDVRESPGVEVMLGLHQKGVCINYSDPYVKSLDLDGQTLKSLHINAQMLKTMDCVVLLTDHSDFDYETIAAHSRLILDCRNAFKDFPGPNVICL